MKPFPAMARAGSAVALLALSGCYYVGPGYYPYGYYPAVVPAVATQHEVPAQGYGYPNGADAQNIPPASPGEPAYVSPVPVHVAPAYYPAYYPRLARLVVAVSVVQLWILERWAWSLSRRGYGRSQNCATLQSY